MNRCLAVMPAASAHPAHSGLAVPLGLQGDILGPRVAEETRHTSQVWAQYWLRQGYVSPVTMGPGVRATLSPASTSLPPGDRSRSPQQQFSAPGQWNSGSADLQLGETRASTLQRDPKLQAGLTQTYFTASMVGLYPVASWALQKTNMPPTAPLLQAALRAPPATNDFDLRHRTWKK